MLDCWQWKQFVYLPTKSGFSYLLKWWPTENKVVCFYLYKNQKCFLFSSDGLLKIKVCLPIYFPLKWLAIEIECMSINLFSARVIAIEMENMSISLISTQVMGDWKMKVCLSIDSPLKWWAIANESMSINLFSTQVMGDWKMKECLSIYSPIKWWAIEIESMFINSYFTQVMGDWKMNVCLSIYSPLKWWAIEKKVCLSIYYPFKWWAIENESMSINWFPTQVMGYWKWKYVYHFILYSSDGLLKSNVCLSIYSPFKRRAIENESIPINLFSSLVMGCWKWKYIYQFIIRSSDGLLKMKARLSMCSPLKW